jgi:hypothetical protein
MRPMPIVRDRRLDRRFEACATTDVVSGWAAVGDDGRGEWFVGFRRGSRSRDATYELATGEVGDSGHLVTAVLSGDIQLWVAFPSHAVAEHLVGVDTAMEP